MWRDGAGRAVSAARRLGLAQEIWGWRPHGAQERFFCHPAQVRVAACGRRWGKTEALSLDIATLALDEPDCRQLVVAPTDAQARLLGNEVLARLLDAWDWRGPDGKPHPAVAGREIVVRHRPSLSIVLTWPGQPSAWQVSIQCRTAGRDGRGIRGLWAHRVVADEASRIPDTVLTDVLLPMLADKGGDYVLASSPAGRRSAYYRLYARGMAPRPQILGEPELEGESGLISTASFQCPTSDNPHINQAFLEAQREELGVTVRDGQIVSEAQAGRLYTLGIDWGRKLDFTVVAVVDATERPARLVYLQRWQGTGWETQARQVGAICARFLPWRILADGNSIGDPLAETLQTEIRAALGPGAGVPTVERFSFGAESKTKLIDRLTLGLSARGLQYPAHRVLLSELRGFEYGAMGSTGRAKMGARSGAHDDVVIALALAWFAAPEGAPPPLRERVLLGSQLRR